MHLLRRVARPPLPGSAQLRKGPEMRPIANFITANGIIGPSHGNIEEGGLGTRAAVRRVRAAGEGPQVRCSRAFYFCVQ